LIAGEVKSGGSEARFGFGEGSEPGGNVVGDGEGEVCCCGESTAAIVSFTIDWREVWR